MTELIWSGIIETSAITAVFITDSDILRAIGGFSMVGVNATSMILIYLADCMGTDSAVYPYVFGMHGIALGQAIGTFISTFILDSDGGFRWGNPLNGPLTLFAFLEA